MSESRYEAQVRWPTPVRSTIGVTAPPRHCLRWEGTKLNCSTQKTTDVIRRCDASLVELHGVRSYWHTKDWERSCAASPPYRTFVEMSSGEFGIPMTPTLGTCYATFLSRLGSKEGGPDECRGFGWSQRMNPIRTNRFAVFSLSGIGIMNRTASNRFFARH